MLEVTRAVACCPLFPHAVSRCPQQRMTCAAPVSSHSRFASLAAASLSAASSLVALLFGSLLVSLVLVPTSYESWGVPRPPPTTPVPQRPGAPASHRPTYTRHRARSNPNPSRLTRIYTTIYAQLRNRSVVGRATTAANHASPPPAAPAAAVAQRIRKQGRHGHLLEQIRIAPACLAAWSCWN